MKPDLRRRQLARIHCLRKDLGLDEQTYRDLLQSVAGTESSAELDDAGRRKVIEHMGGLLGRTGRPAFPGRPTNMRTRPGLRKVEALLADAKRPWTYAHSIAKRMYGRDRVQWCNDKELAGVITALVVDQKRRAAEAARRDKDGEVR